MVSPIQVDVAELAGLVCEGVLYGVFLVLFVGTMYVLAFQRGYRKTNIPMILTSVLMLMLATAQIVVDTTNIFEAFLNLDRTSRIIFLNDVTEPIFAAKHSIYFTMMIVGDFIVIYRCFVVWSRNIWIVLFPILLSLGSAFSAYQTIWAVRHIRSVTIKAEASWGTAVFSLSLSANIISTSLLAYRIWKSDRQMSSIAVNSRSLKPVIKMVVESGAINAAYILAYLVVLQSGSHGLEIMANIATPLIGIIFSLVIVRVGIATQNGHNPSGISSGSHRLNRIPLPVSSTGGHTLVHVDRSIAQDYDSSLEMGDVAKDGRSHLSETKTML